MPLDLEIRAYQIADDWDAIASFRQLAQAVANWGRAAGDWTRLAISEEGSGDPLRKHRGPLSTDALIQAAEDCEGRALRYSAEVPIPCWRCEGERIYEGHAVLGIESWDSQARQRLGALAAIEGNAAVYVLPANPYWALLDESRSPLGPEYNKRVAQNLEALGELFLILAQTVRPRSLKVFSDTGWKLPWNSHCSYFSDAAAVIADLQTLHAIWNTGLPNYGNTPPFQEYDPFRHQLAFSTLRPDEQRSSLWNEFNQALPRLSEVTEDSVEKALQTTALDVHRTDGGFVLFDHPFFLNSFVAPFYLEVLRA